MEEEVAQHPEYLLDRELGERHFDETIAVLRDLPRDPGGIKMPPKSYQDLEWNSVLGYVGEEIISQEGHELLADLSPLPERVIAERRLAEIGEYMAVLADEEEAPIYGLRDIRKAVAHVAKEGTLVAEDLEAIARNCDVASRVRRFFEHRTDRAPLIAQTALKLDPCDDLRDALNHAVEPGGRLSDKASPDLRRLRRAVQNQTERIKTKVDQMLQSDRMTPYLQDDYFTVREDRYVFPVRVGAKTQVDGIVHGYSSSGQTAYVEPNELVELNNALRWAQIEVEEEEQRILYRLSNLVAEHADALAQNTEVMAYLDFVQAAAKFGRAIDGAIPELTEREVHLIDARHPLLYLKLAKDATSDDDNDTVANDVVFDPEKRVLIVSGPNTGGKTVLIKALGLCALLTRCGIPIPCDENSRIPFYDSIYTDIGDEQSIERDLSTFSAHLVNINGFLERCDDGSLVLLDELFTGTDPLQGSALAVALLENLAERGSTTVVTTHLEGLKTLALEDEVFANASMGFDIETLEPTYELTHGIPGSSFAVRIAERLGLAAALTERARDVLEGEGKLSVDEIMAQLEDQVAEVKRERKRLEQARYQAERAKRKHDEEYAALREREQELVHEETQTLKEELDQAREIIRGRVKEILEREGPITRKDLDEMRAEIDEARQNVEKVEERTKPVEPAPSGLVHVDPDDLEPGMEVYAAPFKRNATVLEYREGDGDVQVQVGVMKASAELEDLFYPTEKARREHKSSGASNGVSEQVRQPRQSPSEGVPRTSENTVDLRGARVNEAIEQLDLFLDSAYLANEAVVYIIHGHGTGALKRAVRGHLPESRYVREFRRGERDEGGDGVTVATLVADAR